MELLVGGVLLAVSFTAILIHTMQGGSRVAWGRDRVADAREAHRELGRRVWEFQVHGDLPPPGEPVEVRAIPESEGPGPLREFTARTPGSGPHLVRLVLDTAALVEARP